MSFLKRNLFVLSLLFSLNLSLFSQVIPEYRFDDLSRSSYNISKIPFSLFFNTAGYSRLLARTLSGLSNDATYYLSSPAAGALSDRTMLTTDFIIDENIQSSDGRLNRLDFFFSTDLGRFSFAGNFSYLSSSLSAENFSLEGVSSALLLGTDIGAYSARLNSSGILFQTFGKFYSDLSFGGTVALSETLNYTETIGQLITENLLVTLDTGLLMRIAVPSFEFKRTKNLLIGINAFDLPLFSPQKKGVYLPYYLSGSLGYFLLDDLNFSVTYDYVLPSSDSLGYAEDRVAVASYWKPIPWVSLGVAYQYQKTQQVFKVSPEFGFEFISVAFGWEGALNAQKQGIQNTYTISLSFNSLFKDQIEKKKVEDKKKAKLSYKEALIAFRAGNQKESIKLLRRTLFEDPELKVAQELLEIIVRQRKIREGLSKNLEL